MQLIRECHSWETKYSSSYDRNLCKESSDKEVCNALVLGYLVIQLQRVQLWPGDPDDIVIRMDEKSISDVLWAIRGIHEYMIPKGRLPKCAAAGGGSSSMSHRTCGCTSALLNAVDLIVDAQKRKCLKMPQSVKERLKKQRERFESTNVDARKFQKPGVSRGS